MSVSSSTLLEDLIQSAKDLQPQLKARAPEADTLKRMPGETIRNFKDAGFHKIYMPKAWGGYELNWGAHFEVSRIIGEVCGSSAWTVSLVFSHVIWAARFGQTAQDELLALSADPIVVTGSAGHGVMTPTTKGFELDGQWKFVSGIHHADCAVVTAKSDPDAIFSHFVLLFPGEYEIVETWDTEGLRGTGSHDIRVRRQTIPQHRVVERDMLLASDAPGAGIHDHYVYGIQMAPFQKSWFAGPLLGTARGALDEYLSITKERIGRLLGESIVDQVPVQVRIGETLADIETAELIFSTYIRRLHDIGSQGVRLTGAELLKAKRDMTLGAQLCLHAVERVVNMMGAGGQVKSNPVQRHARDCRAICTHIELQWDHSMAPTGKFLLGLPTGDPLVDNSERFEQDHDVPGTQLGTQI